MHSHHTGRFDLQAVLRESEGQVVELLGRHVNPSFARMLRTIGFDVEYVRGEGAYLWDRAGRRYIDCLGGYAVFNLGRNHPIIRDALKQAMDANLPNLPGVGPFRLSGALAKALIETAPRGSGGSDLDTVYFSNSGTEGVEVALKYARAATGRERFVHCRRSYHGLTLGSLSVNGSAEFREGFGTLLPATEIPFNDLAALEAELRRGDVAAFIVEPIQGKGVNIPAPDYLRSAQKLCETYGALIIADEVQTGYGRTGKMWACEHFGLEPDIMITAKALSGGYVPVGAVLSKRWIHQKVFSSMDRCSVQQTTFSQNDLAMVAGLATLHVLREERLLERAAAMGERLMAGLRQLQGKYELVREVRGRGLMVAIEFGKPRSLRLRAAWELVQAMNRNLFCQAILMPLLTEHGILAQVAGHRLDVIKLIPPLVLSESDVDEIVSAFDATLAACSRFPGPAWEATKKLAAAALKR